MRRWEEIDGWEDTWEEETAQAAPGWRFVVGVAVVALAVLVAGSAALRFAVRLLTSAR